MVTSRPSTLRPIPEARLLRRTDRIARKAQQAGEKTFRSAVTGLRAGVDSSLLAAGLRSRSIEGVVASFPWRQFRGSLHEVDDALVTAFRSGAGLGERLLPNVKSTPANDNEEIFLQRALAWIATYSVIKVTNIELGTKIGLRILLRSAFALPTTVELTAREIMTFIGLNAQQAASFNRFLADIQVNPPPGVATSRGLQQHIDRRYKRMIRARARMIARTEAYDAGNAGLAESWKQAANDNRLDANAYVQEWVARLIGACPICEGLDGKTAEIGGAFFSEAKGAFIERPTAHPHCYCSLRLVRRREGESVTVPLAA